MISHFTMRKTFVRTVYYNKDQTNYQPAYNYMLQLDEDERVIALWREITITEDGTCCMHCLDFPVKDGINRTADIEQLIRDSQCEPLYESENSYAHRSTRSMGQFWMEDEMEEMTMEVTKLKEESAKLKKDNESLNNAIAQLKDENQMLVEECVALRSTNAELKTEADKCQKRFNKVLDWNNDLERNDRIQVEKIQRQAHEIEQQEHTIFELMRQNKGLRRQLYLKPDIVVQKKDTISEEMEII